MERLDKFLCDAGAGTYKQYSYGKLYLALNEGKIIEIWVVDSTSPYLKSVTVLDTLDAGQKGTVVAGGETFIVDSNGYHYYVERSMEDIQNGTTNNYQYVPLLTADGEHFCKETTSVYYGKRWYLQDADGILYNVTYESESYQDTDSNWYYVYAYTVAPLSFGGLDGEVVKKAVLNYTGSANTSKYKEYFLTDKGSLYCFGYSGAYKLTGSGVYLTKMTELFDEEAFSVSYGNTASDSLKFMAMDTNGRIWLMSNYTSLKNVSNGRTYTDFQAYLTESSPFAIAYGTDGKLYVYGTVPYVTGSAAYQSLSVFTDPNTYVDFSQLIATKIYAYNGSCYITDAGILRVSYNSTSEKYCWGELEFDLGYHFGAEVLDNEFFTKNYSTFTGWNTEADGTGTVYAAGDTATLTADLDLYAQWELGDGEEEDDEPKIHAIIHYDENGGSGYMADSVLYTDDKNITLPDCTFTRTGYKFLGWSTTADGAVVYTDGQELTTVPAGEHTLYAQWEENVISYTLTYMKYPYGTAGNAVWKSVTMKVSATEVTKETIKGAPYTPASGYTVTFKINKPDTMSKDPIIVGNVTSLSTTAPTFQAWKLYRNNGSGEYVYVGAKYTKGTTVSRLSSTNGDVLYLYPEWNSGSSGITLPEATCDYYAFDGWCESADGSTEIYYPANDEGDDVASGFTPAKNTTLYAIWSPEERTLSLVAKHATVHTQTSVKTVFDTAGAAVTIPERTNYLFKGYFTEDGGEGTQVYDENGNFAIGMWTSDAWNAVVDDTLYAHWKENEAERMVDFCIVSTSDKSGQERLDAGVQAITIKKGHSFDYRFLIEEKSSSGTESVRILASYYLISEDCLEREEVCIYYYVMENGRKRLLCAGSADDIRNEQKEGYILLNEVETEGNVKIFQGHFLLPADMYVVRKLEQGLFEKQMQQSGITGKESFLIKFGEISVMFQVELQGGDGTRTEFEEWQQTEIYQDAVAAGWTILPGEVIHYNLSSSSAEDYSVGGVE